MILMFLHSCYTHVNMTNMIVIININIYILHCIKCLIHYRNTSTHEREFVRNIKNLLQYKILTYPLIQMLPM